MTDLSLIVTVHSETYVCGPTMRSADIAVDEARAAGHTVQTVIALDRATPETAAYFSEPHFDHWERWEMDAGDLGLVRNASVPRADGRYIAFLDADDLFSANWLAKGVAALDEAVDRGERLIVHPELNVFFDGMRSVLVNCDQRSPLFAPEALYVRNYYDSLLMAPREAHLEHPYVTRDLDAGLAFQDWQFTAETLGSGWRHATLRDTIIFKRRRDSSLLTEAVGRKALLRALPELAADRVRGLGQEVRRA
ncbi:glycosyltransferase family A protein [Nocardioides sp. DS6]|uniref:Glycosyltransferase family A protein n=1 Tax=Nocardioides eburneus TaxID=3231482 RepID=A0ABV3SUP8_9ACTN